MKDFKKVLNRNKSCDFIITISIIIGFVWLVMMLVTGEISLVSNAITHPDCALHSEYPADYAPCGSWEKGV